MPRKISCVFFVYAFLAALSFGAYAAENSSSSETNREGLFSMDVKGAGVYFDRSRTFEIANVGDWGIRAAGLNAGESPIKYSTDGWGGGYSIDAKYALKKNVGLEAVFGQYFAEKRLMEGSLPGYDGGPGFLTAMAFIDGGLRGSNLTRGFFLHANAAPTDGTTGSAKLTYKFYTHSIALHASYDCIQSKDAELGFFAGPAYVNFRQNYSLATVGINAQFSNNTTSHTVEKLTDHLFGAHLGVKGKVYLFRKLSLLLRQTFGLYARQSYLRGEQEIINAAGVTGGGAATFLSLNDRIVIHDRETGFVPQFDTDIALTYDINDRVSISAYYQLGVWLNVSRVENAVIAADLTRILKGGPTRIGQENMSSHAIGGKLSIKF